jgi:multiple sugar transport system ATP-binding protein
VLGVRPEHLVPKVGSSGPAGPSFLVHVTRLEYLGADTLIYGVLEPPFKAIHVISRLSSSASAAHALGDRCEFVVRESDIRRFDRATGRRIDRREAAA